MYGSLLLDSIDGNGRAVFGDGIGGLVGARRDISSDVVTTRVFRVGAAYRRGFCTVIGKGSMMGEAYN